MIKTPILLHFEMAAGTNERKLEKEDLDMELIERNGVGWGDRVGNRWSLFGG